MDSRKEKRLAYLKKIHASPKGSAIELIGKNLIEIAKEEPMIFENRSTVITPTPELQLPLPKRMIGPIFLSEKVEEAFYQLRYLFEAQLLTDFTTYYWRFDTKPADVWFYTDKYDRHYKDQFIDWVWAEGDCREVRKEDIFRLRRLFAEDYSEVEDVEETILDVRNQREGDITVHWMLDYSRHIEDLRTYLPFCRAINYLFRKNDNVVVIPKTYIHSREFRLARRPGK